MSYTLTKGAVQKFMTNAEAGTPVLQVLSYKLLGSANGATPRYKIIVSDGIHYANAMLGTFFTSSFFFSNYIFIYH
jgi:hypothetical protein